jgi:hypothetical protein
MFWGGDWLAHYLASTANDEPTSAATVFIPSCELGCSDYPHKLASSVFVTSRRRYGTGLKFRPRRGLAVGSNTVP